MFKSFLLFFKSWLVSFSSFLHRMFLFIIICSYIAIMCEIIYLLIFPQALEYNFYVYIPTRIIYTNWYLLFFFFVFLLAWFACMLYCYQISTQVFIVLSVLFFFTFWDIFYNYCTIAEFIFSNCDIYSSPPDVGNSTQIFIHRIVNHTGVQLIDTTFTPMLMGPDAYAEMLKNNVTFSPGLTLYLAFLKFLWMHYILCLLAFAILALISTYFSL